MHREVVGAGYDAIGARYHEMSHKGQTRLRFVAEVLARLAPDSTVVDLGCGPGDPATRLLSESHRVLGVDLSTGQLTIARRLAPRAWLVRADITRLSLRPDSADAVVSFYATGHLPSSQHAPLYRAIADWLRPGGLLLTSAPLSPGDGIEDSWLGVPMFFGGIGADATMTAIEAAGLTVEHSEVVDDPQDDGTVEQFLWVTAVKST